MARDGFLTLFEFDRQYGFCEGGWVQPDEGATNYLGRINQATLGQEWLKARLDVSPTAGWHMDPFGNSAISPLLFDGYGFDAHVVSGGRLPTYRLGNVAWGAPFGQTRWHWQQQLQNVWQGAGGAAVMQHIIEGMYMELSGDPDWPGHGCVPPPCNHWCYRSPVVPPALIRQNDTSRPGTCGNPACPRLSQLRHGLANRRRPMRGHSCTRTTSASSMSHQLWEPPRQSTQPTLLDCLRTSCAGLATTHR